MRFHGRFIPTCAALIALQFPSCSSHNPRPTYAFRSSKAEFNLGDSNRFDFEIGSVATDGRRHLAVAYDKYDRANGKKLGACFRLSNDASLSFGPERLLPSELPSELTTFVFTQSGLTAIYASPRPGSATFDLISAQLQPDGATWSGHAQINDEQVSVLLNAGGAFNCAHPSENEIACVWSDTRRGFSLTFFSASHDGGRSWTANQVVEHDFREAPQINPRLVVGAKGRLIVFWSDERDRETLFDIRCSRSDDGGRHWSVSQKVNDDREHVWQTSPTAVALGDKIYVAFEDYREPGEEGSNDWNLYFTASSDNGETWKRNIRINDVQPGVDSNPVLAIDEHGALYSIWRSSRNSIFGEIYFAYSTDGGESWSPSIRVNDADELLYRQPWWDVVVIDGKLLCHWREKRPGWDKFRLIWLEPEKVDNQPQTVDIRPQASGQRAAPAPAEGEELFADDFSTDNLSRWEVSSGVWTLNDQALMGVDPGAETPFSIFARFREPDNYVFRGRFKLDPVNHRMAYIYFHAHPAAHRSYVIENGFQNGVCLSLKEDDSPPISRGMGPFVLDGRPLTQRRFSFQNDRWYQFTLVVTPERVDYFIDGRWMLSYEGRLQLLSERFGIGGWSSAPTYFDDIAVSSLR